MEPREDPFDAEELLVVFGLDLNDPAHAEPIERVQAGLRRDQIRQVRGQDNV